MSWKDVQLRNFWVNTLHICNKKCSGMLSASLSVNGIQVCECKTNVSPHLNLFICSSVSRQGFLFFSGEMSAVRQMRQHRVMLRIHSPDLKVLSDQGGPGSPGVFSPGCEHQAVYPEFNPKCNKQLSLGTVDLSNSRHLLTQKITFGSVKPPQSSCPVL